MSWSVIKISRYVCNFNTCRRLYIDYLFIYLFKWQPYWQCSSPFGLSPRSIFGCQILRVKRYVSTNGPFLFAVLYCIFNISHIYVTRMCLLNVVALNMCWNNAEVVVGSSAWHEFYGLQIWTIYVFIFHIIAVGGLRLKCDGTRAETRFRLFRRNGRVHLNRWGGVSSVDYWQPRCAHQR